MQGVKKGNMIDFISRLNEKQIKGLKRLNIPIKKGYTLGELEEIEMRIEEHAICYGYDEITGDINKEGILLESIVDVLGEIE